jgi:hypothetical protein
MKTVSIGRTRYTVLDSRDVFATHALATGKHKRQKSKGAEKRQYPVFNPDMSTAEYVRQYFALNTSRKIAAFDPLHTLQFEPLRDEPCHAAQGEDTLVDVCPECGSEEFTSQFALVTGIETNYKSCDECAHHWGHE